MARMNFFKTHRLLLIMSAFTLFIGSILISAFGNETCFLWINQNLTPSFGKIARIFSALGEWYAMVFLLISSLWLAFRNTILLVFTWFASACYSWIFKLWLLKGLARPMEYFEKSGTSLNLVEGVKVHHFNSFPSGHTITAFSAAFALVCLFPSTNRWLQVLVLLLAIGCGFSRIILVQHWPLDVAGGAVLGILASYTGHELALRIPESSFLSKPVWSKNRH
jgi:membrane-associated phospholipid phosphatase